MRQHHLCYTAILLLLIAIAPLPIAAHELHDRAAIKGSVAALMSQGDYQQLEELAQTYRSSQARTSSGLWKLTMFYGGLKLFFDTEQREPAFWSSRKDSVAKWVSLYPSSPTARMAYATMLLNRAWSFRGGGYAVTVKSEDWEPFRHYTEQARLYLEEHKDLASVDPYWHEMMITIAYLQNWSSERFQVVLEEGLSRHPSFYQIYFAAMDYYAPKWGGSTDAIEEFAKVSLEYTQATEGFGMYARIYWYASQSQFDNSLFSDSLVDWELMRQGIDDVLARFPDAWNINYFARFACLASDKRKANELLSRIHGSPILQAWGDISTYEQCRDWVEAAGD